MEDRVIEVLTKQIDELQAENAALEAEAADPLCRVLTPNEQQWLPQTSLISLCARLSPELTLKMTEGTLRTALEATKRVNPYLNVGIDAANLAFKRLLNEIPLTVETVEGEADEAAARLSLHRELQLGVDREVCLARVHLLRSGGLLSTRSFLILLGDHLCFDGKSFMLWMSELTSLVSSTSPVSQGKMLEFVDWTGLIPPMEFAPFEPPFASIKMQTKDAVPEDLAASSVDDYVVTVPTDTLVALKERTKTMGTTLNAPLMAAFFAAVADAALQQQREDGHSGPVNVRSVSAVDVRRNLDLPANYMNNSASVVPVHASFETVKDGAVGGGIWPAALAAQQVMMDGIEAGEAYRLNDITKRGAFAEFGPYFDILCLWSNMGRIASIGVDSVEVHLRGAGSNPIISGHPITTANNTMALTLTYAPLLHDRETIEYIGARFMHHIGKLSSA
jgi:hypothetical protein